MNEHTQIKIELLKMQHARYLKAVTPENNGGLSEAYSVECELNQLLATLPPALTLREEVALRLLPSQLDRSQGIATEKTAIRWAYELADAFLAHGKPQPGAAEKDVES